MNILSPDEMAQVQALLLALPTQADYELATPTAAQLHANSSVNPSRPAPLSGFNRFRKVIDLNEPNSIIRAFIFTCFHIAYLPPTQLQSTSSKELLNAIKCSCFSKDIDLSQLENVPAGKDCQQIKAATARFMHKVQYIAAQFSVPAIEVADWMLSNNSQLVDGLVLLMRQILVKLDVESAKDYQQEIGHEACFDSLCEFMEIREHREQSFIVFPEHGLLLQVQQGRVILSDSHEATVSLSKLELDVKQSGHIQKLYSFERNLAQMVEEDAHTDTPQFKDSGALNFINIPQETISKHMRLGERELFHSFKQKELFQSFKGIINLPATPKELSQKNDPGQATILTQSLAKKNIVKVKDKQDGVYTPQRQKNSNSYHFEEADSDFFDQGRVNPPIYLSQHVAPNQAPVICYCRAARLARNSIVSHTLEVYISPATVVRRSRSGNKNKLPMPNFVKKKWTSPPGVKSIRMTLNTQKSEEVIDRQRLSANKCERKPAFLKNLKKKTDKKQYSPSSIQSIQSHTQANRKLLQRTREEYQKHLSRTTQLLKGSNQMLSFGSSFYNRHGLKQTANLKKYDLEKMCKPSSGLGQKNNAAMGNTSVLSQETPHKQDKPLSPGPITPNNYKFNRNAPNPYTSTLPGRMAEKFGRGDRQSRSQKALRSSENKFAF